MKISTAHERDPISIPGGPPTAHTGARAGQSKDGPSHPTDAVDVSPEARLLARVRAQLEVEAQQPSERVQALKAQLRSGHYQVDPEALAQRLQFLFQA